MTKRSVRDPRRACARRLRGDATACRRSSTCRQAPRRAAQNEAARTLLDAVRRPGAEPARRRGASRTTSTSRRRMARIDAARAQVLLAQSYHRARTSTSGWTAAARASPRVGSQPLPAGHATPVATTIASRRRRRPTSSTCGASTAAGHSPRATTCAASRYYRETVRITVASDVASSVLPAARRGRRTRGARGHAEVAHRRAAPPARPLRRRPHRRLRPEAGRSRALRRGRRHRAGEEVPSANSRPRWPR